MVRLAMIGCGQISERFFKQAEARDDARFVATCARRLESAERKGREHGIDRWFDDYRRMLDEVRPDGVVITTPHSLHAEPAIAALEQGIHVLDEKPMATTLADCRAMVAAAERGGAQLMCLPFDHSPAFLTALEYLNEAHLGKLTGAEAALLIPGPPRDNWYYDRSVSHGGAMLDCQVYPVSRLISLLGPAKRVAGMVNTLIPHRIVGDGKRVESDVDDNVTLVVEWETGQQAVIRTLWGTSFTRNDTTVYGRQGTLWISGGQVILHAPGGLVAGGEPIEWQGFKDCYRMPISPSTPNESMIDHFVQSIRTGSEPRCSGRLQLHVHEILFKGYEAAATGRTLDLETTFEPWHQVDPAFYDTRGGFV
ncbi:MAG: oxidoreductase domain protein [Armatimonadetes bacterium]|nr:oxidoreductase domain protein [Armatimonadota bacterium]